MSCMKVHLSKSEITSCPFLRRLRVLPEGPGREEGTLTSRSDGNLIVEFPGGPSLVGNFVEVQITGAMNWALKGEVVK